MPSTRVVKTKPVQTTEKVDKLKAGRSKAAGGSGSEAKPGAARRDRAPSCSRRDPQTQLQPQQQPTTRGRCERTSRPGCERRTRSTVPKPAETRSGGNGDPRRASSCARPGLEARIPAQSNKAFTVIPPNPKKRREIQKKAEAELAALEELRLSRAMAYVSISPCSVGGCMSLQEVRLKQQQEMMQAKKKQKQIKKELLEETSVLTS